MDLNKMGKQMLFLLLFAWGLSGCSSLFAKRLGTEDIEGVWESVGFVPYARLTFSESGEGVLVAVYGEESYAVFTLNNFESQEAGFTVNVVDNSRNGEAEKLEGSFFNGQLNLKGVADDDEGVWFTKAERLAAFKRFALEKLKSHWAEEKAD